MTREIHILKIVRHPNVIQLYEVSTYKYHLITNLNLYRLLRHQDSCSWLWSMLQVVNYSTTSSKEKDFKKMKPVDLVNKSFQVWITFTRIGFVIEILNQKIYSWMIKTTSRLLISDFPMYMEKERHWKRLVVRHAMQLQKWLLENGIKGLFQIYGV